MNEIERKFLIDVPKFLEVYRPIMLDSIEITQGYLNQDPNRTVRIRFGNYKAFITVKGKSSENGLSRFEWEKEIDVLDAKQMMIMCTGIISKTRYHVTHEGKLWEIDAFHGDNDGLVVAEVELTSEDEKIEIPAWVTKEVTGDPKYYNSNLSANPYKGW